MIQIQPIYTSFDAFTQLALSESFTFEALEPSYFDNNKERDCRYITCGLVTSVHGAFIDINPASSDPLFRALSEKRCRESCEFAKQAGAKNVVFHSSCFPFLRGAYLENLSSICADFYSSLANEYGLDIFIENSPDVDPVPLKAVMKKATGSNVKICLDIGHAMYSRCTLDEWVNEIGEYTGYLHLSDNKGCFDDHLPIGSGVTDWHEADRLLSYLPADTPLTLEVGSIENIKKSVDFLRSNKLFGM